MGLLFHKKTLPFLMIAVVALSFFAVNIMADSGEAAKKEEAKQTPSLPAAKLARDPDGALRAPTEKEERELSAKIQQTLRKYPRQRMQIGKDGKSKSLVIAPYNFRWSVATAGSDGKVHYSCAENPKQIDAAVESANAKTDSKLEKE